MGGRVVFLPDQIVRCVHLWEVVQHTLVLLEKKILICEMLNAQRACEEDSYILLPDVVYW